MDGCTGCPASAARSRPCRPGRPSSRNHELLENGGRAITDLIDAVLAAKAEGASEPQLAPALELQRQAQWRLDFIAAENSMGFHAPQEAARVLGEAADLARQGQIAALRWRGAGQ